MSGKIDPDEALEQSKVLFNRKRLVTISKALKAMEVNAHTYLNNFESSSEYRIFRTSFRQFQFTSKLTDIVDFKVCDNADPDTSFYRHTEKKIVVCYNKLKDYAHFNQIMKYNLVFLYDDLRANINWLDCSMMSCMKIRGLHLSLKCKKNDLECFQDEVKQSLERSEICKGKFDEYFADSYKQCISDISPINSLHQTKHTIFF